MTRKDEKQRWVVLSIIGLVVGFCIVKNVILPWFDENREVAIPWIVRGLLLGIFGLLCFFPLRNLIIKRRFLSKYGKLFDVKNQITSESKKVMQDISKELTALEKQLQSLVQDSSHFKEKGNKNK